MGKKYDELSLKISELKNSILRYKKEIIVLKLKIKVFEAIKNNIVLKQK